MRQSIVGLALGAIVMAGGSDTAAPRAEKPGWQPLFDGATLNGWKAAEHPDSWTVKDGTLSCNGERAHRGATCTSPATCRPVGPAGSLPPASCRELTS